MRTSQRRSQLHSKVVSSAVDGATAVTVNELTFTGSQLSAKRSSDGAVARDEVADGSDM